VPNSSINQGLVAITAPNQGETTPNYSLNKARSGSDSLTASTSPLTHQPRHSKPLQLSSFDPIFMSFRGPEAQMDSLGNAGIVTYEITIRCLIERYVGRWRREDLNPPPARSHRAVQRRSGGS
jgi:hypothetical protein